ncbi:hypothetical protein HZC33_01290 [Candidatus Wolfebacteria bacterium]|nr:hypothetical protein [Candidatus Wolfebacteria bacterium]
MTKKIAIALLGLSPLLVFAQPSVPTVTGLSSYAGIITTIDTLANWMLGILVAVAAIFYLYAGYLYLMASGNEEQFAAAKSYIIYATVAVAVGLLSKTITALLQSFLGTAITP